MTKKLVSLVVPFYNESENVSNTLQTIEAAINGLDYQWELVAVNDGSRDNTLEALEAYRPQAMTLRIVDLSRNFGKEAALSAGLAYAKGDAAIPLDADLQDPPELIPEMLALWENGAEVVLARRADRSSDGWLKRLTARAFYRSMNRLSEVTVPADVGDFRLLDRAVVDVLNSLPEHRRFMKGLYAWAGFRTAEVQYVRPERAAGETKFSGWKLWNLAIEGITSFSIAPLKVWTYLGLCVASVAFFYAAYIVARTLIVGADVPGYASLVTIVLFMGGVQLIGLGVLGEYVGRVYLESKRRPPFIVRRVRSIPAESNFGANH